MYCTNCGTPRPDGATACANCGAPVQHFPPQPGLDTYLVPAVLTTLCCSPCGTPFGIVAIVYAAQVNSKLAAGDLAGATRASQNAKMWTWIGAGVGILVALAYAVLTAIGIVSAG